MTAVAACRTCGTEPLENARFCHGCGSPVAEADTHAEYKQVTVLFADVVHSMNIAAVVGAERLREIMADLVNRAMAVVQRYGATVDQFTGDGILAVFGAPWRSRITLSVPVWLLWRSSGRSTVWPPKSIDRMVSVFGCGWA
jgi:adenylate cyclase